MVVTTGPTVSTLDELRSADKKSKKMDKKYRELQTQLQEFADENGCNVLFVLEKPMPGGTVFRRGFGTLDYNPSLAFDWGYNLVNRALAKIMPDNPNTLCDMHVDNGLVLNALKSAVSKGRRIVSEQVVDKLITLMGMLNGDKPSTTETTRIEGTTTPSVPAKTDGTTTPTPTTAENVTPPTNIIEDDRDY